MVITWDCWGCHGWYDKYSVAPYSGVTVPFVSSLSSSSFIEGRSSTVVLNGSGFVNDIVDPNTGILLERITPVVVISSENTSLTVIPTSFSQDQITFILPATLQEGVYDLQVVKKSMSSNKKTFNVVPDIRIAPISLSSGGVLTISGSGFGVNPTSQDYKTGLGVYINSYEAKIISWSDSKIVCQSPYAKKKAFVTVKTLLGSASRRI